MLETTVRIKPVDRDGPSIVIFKEANSGKVAIGRGEFLRCADKKVSRVHAELGLDVDGQLHLTPLHVNPCFYFRGGDEQSREEVRKGDNKILNGGDHFSLLPSSYVYKVDVERVGSVMVDTRNKEKLSNGGSKLLDDDTQITEPISSKFNNTGENLQNVKKINAQRQASNNNAETDDEEPETRKRTLPPWLVEAAAAQSVDKRQAGPSASSSKAANKKQPAKSSQVKSNDKIEPKDKPSTSRRQSFSNSKDNESVDSVIKYLKTLIKDSPEQMKNDEKKRRVSCKFGEMCFRKNPAHFEEFRHPGDDDYSLDSNEDDEAEREESAVDPNDPRPECEYGLKCYRKNTQHRLDYKHTSRPRTQRKAAKEAKKKTSRRDAGSDDSNDSFEDSFIDDDDSDEYKPSQDAADYSDDDCEEDLKRLKREADSFVKNKKFHKMP